MKDPNGQTTGAQSRFTYDARNRLLTVDDPTGIDKNSLGHTVNYTYDQAGNKKSEQRANDQVVTYDTYDAMNRLTQMTVRQSPTPNAVTKYTWTKAGQVDTMTDPRLKVYNYDYDGMNRLIRTTYPADSGGAARTETRTYDAAGNVATFKNRAGNVQTFAYDARNRETRYDWNDGVTPYRVLAYDDASNITDCDSSGVGINFAYYNDNTLKSQEEWTSYYSDNAHHRIVTYTYDGDGRRATIQYPSGKKYSTTYTPRSEPRAVWDVTSGPATAFQAYYIYDPSGNLTTRNINQYQTHTTSSYDVLNRLTQSQHFLAGSSPKFNYGYDEMSNRKYEQRDGTLADGFGYDVNNQLASFRRDGTFSGGSVSGGALNTLAYDASGNRTSVVENGATTTYAAANNLNQYPTVGGVGATYDGNGNLKTFNGWTYTYDAMNRLTAASKTGASATFHYDGLNRQITRNFNGNGLVYFSVWAGWDLVEEYTQGDALYASYLQGAKSDELISMTRSGQAYYFFQDGRGNTSQVANSSGALVETCKYDVHGEPAITVAPGKTATGNRFLFTGREYYQSLGLYNYRNRFYSPEWGRFLQPDPIGFAGDPANLYRYCGNNSVNKSDANGLIDNHKPKPLEYTGGGDFNPSVTLTGSNIPLTFDHALQQGYSASVTGFASFISDHAPGMFGSTGSFLGIANGAFSTEARGGAAVNVSITTVIREGHWAGIKTIQSGYFMRSGNYIPFAPYVGSTNIPSNEHPWFSARGTFSTTETSNGPYTETLTGSATAFQY